MTIQLVNIQSQNVDKLIEVVSGPEFESHFSRDFSLEYYFNQLK